MDQAIHGGIGELTVRGIARVSFVVALSILVVISTPSAPYLMRSLLLANPGCDCTDEATAEANATAAYANACATTLQIQNALNAANAALPGLQAAVSQAQSAYNKAYWLMIATCGGAGACCIITGGCCCYFGGVGCVTAIHNAKSKQAALAAAQAALAAGQASVVNLQTQLANAKAAQATALDNLKKAKKALADCLAKCKS